VTAQKEFITPSLTIYEWGCFEGLIAIRLAFSQNLIRSTDFESAIAVICRDA